MPTPTPTTATTENTQNIISTSSKQECIDGIKQANEAFKQGQQLIVRCDNAELITDPNKAIHILYRWLLEENTHYNIYSIAGEGYVDIYIYDYPTHVIAVKDINDAPAKIKEYLDGLENPANAAFDLWCLEDEFLKSNGETGILSCLDEIGYLSGYDVTSGIWSSEPSYEGIQISLNNRALETKRVYSTEELAEYIKTKEAEAGGMPARLHVFFHSDSISEHNYQEIISTMCEKEGIRTRYAKYVKDGVLYLDY